MVTAPASETISSLLGRGRRALAGAVDEPYLETQLLLAAAVEKPRSYVLAHPEASVDCRAARQFSRQLDERRRGRPLAYILRRREFWSLELMVAEATLIPRPETELLVERALACLPPKPVNVLDLGTGCGAIALALKTERPAAVVSAVDVDPAALAVATANGRQLGLEVEWIQSDWFSALQGRRFHMLVANPPYVASTDPHLSKGDAAFEPRRALEAGATGLDCLYVLIDGAGDYLVGGGDLLLEHGYDQGPMVRARLQAAGFSNILTYRDLAQRERVTVARTPEPRQAETL